MPVHQELLDRKDPEGQEGQLDQQVIPERRVRLEMLVPLGKTESLERPDNPERWGSEEIRDHLDLWDLQEKSEKTELQVLQVPLEKTGLQVKRDYGVIQEHVVVKEFQEHSEIPDKQVIQANPERTVRKDLQVLRDSRDYQVSGVAPEIQERLENLVPKGEQVIEEVKVFEVTMELMVLVERPETLDQPDLQEPPAQKDSPVQKGHPVLLEKPELSV